jgi:hypothetical protein
MSATSTQPMSLADLQRQMVAAIMQPLTPDEQMRANSADGRDMTLVAATFIAPNGRLTPFERLEIYNQQYWFRIKDVLVEDFRALRIILGSAAFERLSIAYLEDHPSRSFSLRNLGSRMVDWLVAHPGYSGRRHRLAVDVARIEWAFVEAFDNAEREPLTAEQIATLDGDSQLALQPHLRLIALEHPADDLVLDLNDGEKQQRSEAGRDADEAAEAIPPAKFTRLPRKPAFVAAHRVDNSVYYLRLKREEFLTLAALGQGLSLGEALQAGFEDSRSALARRPGMVRDFFAHWAELGWICAPEIESLIQS